MFGASYCTKMLLRCESMRRTKGRARFGIGCAYVAIVVNATKKILLVEDNGDCRKLLAMFITRLGGYEVFEAHTGLQAIEEAGAIGPDLIMMDLSLPGMTGHEATACLKANPSTRDIPIVITTAHVPGLYRNRALALGAAEILHKPFELTNLTAVLRKYLSDQSDATRLETKNPIDWKSQPKTPPISPEERNI
jgi:CheY-like chemotaxis protein